MTSDPNLRPYGEGEPEQGNGGGVHLSDYWQIITRRLWLVLLIFGVTTASAIWAVSRQEVFHQAHLSMQINDPLERTRSLVPGTRISSMTIYIDPVQSEMEVLKSATVAGMVVDSLGLRLEPESSDILRSHLYEHAWVSPELAQGRFQLTYDESGERAQLRSEAGEVLAEAPVGFALETEGLRLVPRAPPTEARTYGLSVISRQAAIPQVRGGIAASPRTNTNLVDVSLIHRDRELAPEMLNMAVRVLREFGADRVKEMASREVEFIETRLDDARSQLDQSMASIRSFKETQAFTNLSLQEQSLVNQAQELMERIEVLDRRRSAFAATLRNLEDGALTDRDLVNLTAELAEVQTPQLERIIEQLQEAGARLQALLVTEGKTRDHPDARAIISRIRDLEADLQDALRANLRVLEERLDVLSRQLDEIRAEQQQFPALENRLQTLQVQQRTDEEQYRYLLTQLQQARITEAAATPYVDIIDPAVGASPIQPRGRVNVLLGALLGLVLGLGSAFFLEYLDRTVRTSADIETLLGIPVLGIIPRLRTRDEDEDEEILPRRSRGPLIVALDPVDPAAEAFRNLRMNLMFMGTEEAPVHTITISSPGPEEGKSTAALNLALILAQQGQRVLLVDADLRRPALHRSLDLLREPGLTNLLVGEVETREAIRPNVLPNLDFLPSGPFPPNPAELLDSKAMQGLLSEMSGKYRHVVIDSPPVLAVTDAALLAGHTDGLILVLRSGETEQRAAERAVDQLRRVGVRVFGAVLNSVAATTSDESYYLQYYHTYQPEEEEERPLSRLWRGVSKARLWMMG